MLPPGPVRFGYYELAFFLQKILLKHPPDWPMLRRDKNKVNNAHETSNKAISAMSILRFVQQGTADIAQLVHYLKMKRKLYILSINIRKKIYGGILKETNLKKRR